MSGPGSEPVAPSKLQELRNSIGAEFQKRASLLSASRRPLPDQTGDGTYVETMPEPPGFLEGIGDLLKDMTHLGIHDVGTLVEVVEKNKTGEYWDDRDYLMEKLIQTAAKLPVNSETSKKVTNAFLTTLYNDLQHPPISYLGDAYQYRSADGSFNSLMHPKLGAAGTPYARTVAPKAMQPGALPDPGVIFDSIMARKPENVTEHPNHISSILFYHASIIIHDLFRTNRKDPRISDTSSYLDLAPLYGSNFEEQMKMRTGVNGKLKPDAFSEVRLMSFPPGVGVMLVMYNRFHNHVVEQLALINEGNRFRRGSGDVPTVDTTQQEWWNTVDKTWRAYDEDLFQVGRLVTCGLYINVTLLDYVRTILNLNKSNSDWALNPRAEIKGVPVAAGNQVSAEFNLVYRWHSTISTRDEKWTEDFVKSNFDGQDINKMDPYRILGKLGEIEAKNLAVEPGQRTWGGLKRQADGTFPDDGLVDIITASIDDCANSYGANRVPLVMRAVEVLGMQQARQWNLASLNEFRSYFSLLPHKKFTDINSDPYVAAQLERLYDHPDQVELYPGFVAEEAKVAFAPGAGLTPSFTVSRAVLSDAVALVRGDRFYTIDYHPKKLTNWGYSAAASSVGINHGCVMYKLFLTAFPHHFRPNSVYIHFPMTTPIEMKKVLEKLETDNQFSWDKPARLPATKIINSYAAIKSIITDDAAFHVTWDEAAEYFVGSQQKNTLSTRSAVNHVQTQDILLKSLAIGSSWPVTVRNYFEQATSKMIRAKKYKLANLNQVDIVRDIGNLVPVHFVSELFALPLKTAEVPSGIFTEHELYLALLAIYTAFSDNTPSVNGFDIRAVSHKAVQTLAQLVEDHIDEISGTSILGSVRSIVGKLTAGKESLTHKSGTEAIKALFKSKVETKQIVWGQVLSTAAGFMATQGNLFANVIAYIINQPLPFQEKLSSLANASDDAAFETLMHYVLEAARLSCENAVYRTVATAKSIPNGEGPTIQVQPGDHILLNFRAACLDPAAFPEPATFNPERPLQKYLPLGFGPHENLGSEASAVALTAMCKVVLGLGKLSPAAGAQGKIHKVNIEVDVGSGKETPVKDGYSGFLTENWDAVWPVPQTMKINWV